MKLSLATGLILAACSASVCTGFSPTIIPGPSGPFVRIADSSTPVPGGTGNFDGNFGIELPITHQGSIYFGAQGTAGEAGIYQYYGSSLTAVIDNSANLPGGSNPFTSFTSPSISNDALVFAANDNDFLRVIVAIGLGGLEGTTASANTLTEVPGTEGDTFSSFGPPVAAGDTVAFVGIWGFEGSNRDVIFGEETGLINTTFGAGVSPISSQLAFDGTTFAFWGTNGSITGIYTAPLDSPFTAIVDENTLIPGTSDTFGSFGSPPAVSNGSVYFRRADFSGPGIWRHDGSTLDALIEAGDAVPGITGFTFTNFGGFSVDGDSLVFQGEFSDGGSGIGQGLFFWDNGQMATIIDNLAPLDDITNFALEIGEEAWNDGNLAFRVRDVTNPSAQTQLIYGVSVTEPIPEPSTYALLALGIGAIGFSLVRKTRG